MLLTPPFIEHLLYAVTVIGILCTDDLSASQWLYKGRYYSQMLISKQRLQWDIMDSKAQV